MLTNIPKECSSLLQVSINDNIKSNLNKTRNNFTTSKRKDLLRLANEDSIVIKMADNGGAIVIMNKDNYISACEEVFTDERFLCRNKNRFEPLLHKKAREDNF